MKYLTMLYRKFTHRCIYCGLKKEKFRHMMFGSGGRYLCPTSIDEESIIYDHDISWRCGYNGTGCITTKKFIKHKESKVQKALGLLSGPKGIDT